MKIAYLCNIYPHTTHTFIRREIKGLEVEGVEVKRITIRRSTDALPTPEDYDELSRTIGVLERGIFNLLISMLIVSLAHPLAIMRTTWRAVRFGMRSNAGLLRHIAYLGEACVILRYCRKVGIAHIHAHFGTNAAMVAMLVRNLGGPTFSFTIHGCGEWDCPEFLHIRQKVEDATFVTAISDFAKGQTYRWTEPKQWDKIHVVRCGVDRSFFSCSVSAVPDVARLIMIGRLGRSKGHGILFQALERLLREEIQFHVKLVGDGPLREFVERQVTERGLAQHIEITGWMDNNSVREAILASRAMVLPSFGEGLPVVIMEAFALARPVICTRIGGISELVIDRQNGWLVNSGSVEELAAALREVLKTPVAHLTEMGLAGRQAVLQKHDAFAEAKKLAELLRTYVNEGQRAA